MIFVLVLLCVLPIVAGVAVWQVQRTQQPAIVSSRRSFPNGWSMPTFFNVSEDGKELIIEWCFGEQASKNGWRLTFCDGVGLDPMYAIKTTHQGSTVVEGKDTLRFIAKELNEATRG